MIRYVGYEYTASLEAKLDAISASDLDSAAFLSEWWAEFHPAVDEVMQADTQALRETVVESLAWFLTPVLPGGARRRW